MINLQPKMEMEMHIYQRKKKKITGTPKTHWYTRLYSDLNIH